MSLITSIPGLVIEPDFITRAEELDLLERVGALSFGDIRMHGVVAKRKAVHFGWDYGYDSLRIEPTVPIPDWLATVRDRCGRLAAIEPSTLAQALVAHYPAGAGIGWHRDAPMFGAVVVGLSLLGSCEMRFRRIRRAPRERSERILLPPRSAYVLGGQARSDWQHSIPPVKQPRYSITFRTLRRRRP